jgi:hypothetical protein
MNIADRLLWVIRLPEIHAVGHIVGAIVAAEFGQLAEIQARYGSLEVVSIDDYPEYIAGMIRRAAEYEKEQEKP